MTRISSNAYRAHDAGAGDGRPQNVAHSRTMTWLHLEAAITRQPDRHQGCVRDINNFDRTLHGLQPHLSYLHRSMHAKFNRKQTCGYRLQAQRTLHVWTKVMYIFTISQQRPAKRALAIAFEPRQQATLHVHRNSQVMREWHSPVSACIVKKTAIGACESIGQGSSQQPLSVAAPHTNENQERAILQLWKQRKPASPQRRRT